MSIQGLGYKPERDWDYATRARRIETSVTDVIFLSGNTRVGKKFSSSFERLLFYKNEYLTSQLDHEV